MRAARRTLLIALTLLLPAPAVTAAGAATDLFRERQRAVYQIRVIDVASGDKATIGSGFAVSDDGLIATNFHVVSDYVHDPEKYRLEYLALDDSVGPLTLEGIDVVHDLAVVKADISGAGHFRLGGGELAQGDRIYSMGNPRDLGMTIIEGTYNGYVSVSRYRKILFSGSLNPGMSGGPAMAGSGEIIGVNVSTGGEQISFLVPVEFLRKLLADVQSRGEQDPAGFKAGIGAALLADQADFYQEFIARPFKTEPFGDFSLPVRLTDAVKCWGHTLDDDDDERYVASHKHCATEDSIFVRSDLRTGEFFYDYEWMTPGDLNLSQFYFAVEQRFDHRGHYNVSEADDTGDYACENAFIRLAGHAFKISTCRRGYSEYPGLYDLLLLMVSVDMNDRALLVKLGASGIGGSQATRLLRRFLESIQ